MPSYCSNEICIWCVRPLSMLCTGMPSASISIVTLRIRWSRYSLVEWCLPRWPRRDCTQPNSQVLFRCGMVSSDHLIYEARSSRLLSFYIPLCTCASCELLPDAFHCRHCTYHSVIWSSLSPRILIDCAGASAELKWYNLCTKIMQPSMSCIEGEEEEFYMKIRTYIFT